MGPNACPELKSSILVLSSSVIWVRWGFLGRGIHFWQLKWLLRMYCIRIGCIRGCIVGVFCSNSNLVLSSSVIWVRWGFMGRGIHFWQLRMYCIRIGCIRGCIVGVFWGEANYMHFIVNNSTYIKTNFVAILISFLARKPQIHQLHPD